MSTKYSKNGSENMAKKKMTEKEIQDWDALYMHVKNNIMGYDENDMLRYVLVDWKKDGKNYRYAPENRS